jgi:hypothetical protein
MDSDDIRKARQGETIAPEFQKEAFHCLVCGVLTAQAWTQLQTTFSTPTGVVPRGDRVWKCRCRNCDFESYWLEGIGQAGPLLLYPFAGNEPMPHPSMPEDVARDYQEARSIAQRSPRGACALLRLALQKLTPHLGEGGKDLDKDIAELVKKGLDPGVQQALDALRVIGNNAVHPGELDLRDDVETTHALFEVLNYVVEQQIERPKKLEQLYSLLPESAKEAIERRDSE